MFHLVDLPKQETSSYLFFKTEHLCKQIGGAIYSFILSRDSKSVTIASFHCYQNTGSAWYSPPRAPFGGIAVEENCSTDQLNFFLTCIEEWIRINKGKQLIVKCAPSCYNPILSQQLHQVYLSTGFLPISTLPSHYIPVTSENFYDNLHVSEKRRLKKAIGLGFETHLNRSRKSDKIYPFLRKCLNQKGYSPSLSHAEFESLLNAFPDDFRAFSATDGDHIIAFIVTVRVASNIIYIFSSGYLPEYSSCSPVVLLTKTIYEFCQQNEISILDLGTSLDHLGQEKSGLIRFKKNLGGHVCTKVTYSKEFEKM